MRQGAPKEPAHFTRAMWDKWVREMKKERDEAESKKPCCPVCSKPLG